MRKKYLSALLFGALLFASAGTFTSCKDYDDDISNLQSQIDTNTADIKALQEKINNGMWVTSVTSIDGGFTIAFSDGTSYEQTALMVQPVLTEPKLLSAKMAIGILMALKANTRLSLMKQLPKLRLLM